MELHHGSVKEDCTNMRLSQQREQCIKRNSISIILSAVGLLSEDWDGQRVMSIIGPSDQGASKHECACLWRDLEVKMTSQRAGR